jgi:hypothetical protein
MDVIRKERRFILFGITILKITDSHLVILEGTENNETDPVTVQPVE